MSATALVFVTLYAHGAERAASSGTMGVETNEQTTLQVEGASDANAAIRSRMSGVRSLRMRPIPGGLFLDADGKRIAIVTPATALGPAKQAVQRTIEELSYAFGSFGSAVAQHSEFRVLLDRGFKPRIIVGCPEDPEARTKVPACVEADRAVRTIQWSQVIDGAENAQGGSITIDRDGNVQEFHGTVLDPGEVPDFSIREEQAKCIAIEHVRAERVISDLDGIARAVGGGTGRFYSLDDDSNVIAYWEFEVVVTSPDRMRRHLHYVRVDATTGTAHSVDFHEQATPSA